MIIILRQDRLVDIDSEIDLHNMARLVPSNDSHGQSPCPLVTNEFIPISTSNDDCSVSSYGPNQNTKSDLQMRTPTVSANLESITGNITDSINRHTDQNTSYNHHTNGSYDGKINS